MRFWNSIDASAASAGSRRAPRPDAVVVDNPAPPTTAHTRSELTLRIVSSAVLAPLAIAIAYVGGWLFVVFWAAAAVGIFWEWWRIVADRAPAWIVPGIIYAGALVVSCVLLRADPAYGFTAIIFLFAIVWATDISAYFVGRSVGGPRLWARLSPNKTWSGAVGGACAAMIAGLAIAHFAQIANSLAVAGLALVLSAVSQAGDLFESAFKRRFGVKDASHVIPGHGGIMDRLDGFLAAAAVAAAIGVARGGTAEAARGLLVW
jgi:phosphatidate cytidylyltransferase